MEAKQPSHIDARELLRRHWGYSDFRRGQWEIIEHVLEGRDVLAILPTGGGKSICYQIPALMNTGMTIVVSPLIALMQDQVAGLRAHGIAAACINSTLTVREIDQCWTDAEHGRYRLLYVAPERLDSERFLARVDRMDISLLAVDEAHCISEWGHNFRPAYLEIAAAREKMGRPPTLALTATATPSVREDIVKQLALREPRILVRGFDRPNVVWSVFRTENKRSKVLDVLAGVPGSGIIYSGTRRGVENWSDWLNRRNVSAAAYHGGMEASVRERMQEGWVAGEQRIMVATNAFGMGIDKPDVRFVVHVDTPSTLEGYYQEAGRGGRDGKTSYAVLLYHEGDDETPRRLIEDGHPSAKEVRSVYDAVCNLAQLAVGSEADEPILVQQKLVSKVSGLSPGKIRTSVELLARQGAWKVLPMRKHFGLIRFGQPASTVRGYAEGLKNERLGRFVRELLRTVHADAFSSWWEIDLRLLEQRTNMERGRLLRGMNYLRTRELFEWRAPDRAMRVELLHARSATLHVDSERVRVARKRAEVRLNDMLAYVESESCRRHFLLSYFGEDTEPHCGSCDVCLKRHDAFVPTDSDRLSLRRVLAGIAAARPRSAWFSDESPPGYQVDQLLNWLINEGYLRQVLPLGDRFDLTEKGRSILESLEWSQ